MIIRNSVVFITGANRGLGKAFAQEALERGARTVYAAARDPGTVTLPGVVPIALDVTKSDSVAAAAHLCGDVTLLINNAGIAHLGGFLAADSEEEARVQLDTNFFGPLRLAKAFAPHLATHGGGAMLNVLSVASWLNFPLLGVYGASKSAAWALTNGLRQELKSQGTQVLGLHAGFIDTDMTRGLDGPKATPQQIVAAAYDGLEAGLDEVMADEITRQVKQSLSAQRPIYISGLPTAA